MAQVYKKIHIDVNSKVTDIITAVQNDAQSRYLDVVLLNGSMPIDLTGHEVRIYGKKFDSTEIYNNGEITEPTGGRCQFELTSQALAVANDLEVQIVVFYDNVEVLSTQAFTIHVVKSLMTDSAIESSNEYGALVVLYQNLYEAYDLMVEMVQKIGVPGEQAESLNLDTMFEVWDWMVEYLQANSAAGIVETVNTISSRTGTHDSTSDETVMGKLNEIKSMDKIYAASNVERHTILSTTVTSPETGHKLVQKFKPKRIGIIRVKVVAENESGSGNINFYIHAYGSSPFPTKIYSEYLAAPAGTLWPKEIRSGYIGFTLKSTSGLAEQVIDLPVFAGWDIVFILDGSTDAAYRTTVHSIKICYDEEVI